MSVLSLFYEKHASHVGSLYDRGLDGEKPKTALKHEITPSINNTFSKGTYENYVLEFDEDAVNAASRDVDTTAPTRNLV